MNDMTRALKGSILEQRLDWVLERAGLVER